MDKPWVCLKCIEPMEWRDGGLFQKCPSCGREVWEPDENYESREMRMASGSYVSRSLPPKYRVPPGGSKSAGKAKKKPPVAVDRYRLE